ncbi:hypothetical protein K2X33_02215, partial [bacterium]|nr:hypothetical protein [bacterium]
SPNMKNLAFFLVLLSSAVLANHALLPSRQVDHKRWPPYLQEIVRQTKTPATDDQIGRGKFVANRLYKRKWDNEDPNSGWVYELTNEDGFFREDPREIVQTGTFLAAMIGTDESKTDRWDMSLNGSGFGRFKPAEDQTAVCHYKVLVERNGVMTSEPRTCPTL